MKHPLPEKTFLVVTWWLHGWPIGRIASWVNLTHGSVRGIVWRNLPTPREQLTTEERQQLLDEMKANRVDMGRLPDLYFTAGEVSGARDVKLDGGNIKDSVPKPSAPKGDRASRFPRKAAPEAPKPPDPSTKDGRRLLRERAQRAEQAKRREEQQRKLRELGFAPRGGDVAALEWLTSHKILADPADVTTRDSDGSGVRRLAAGLELRKLYEGVRIGSMNSVSLEGSSGGGTSGALQTITAYRLDCIHDLGAIRKGMASMDAWGDKLIEEVVDRDAFVWHRVYAAERQELFERIRRALDVVALYLGMMDGRGFAERWGKVADLGGGMDWQEARALADVARDLIQGATE